MQVDHAHQNGEFEENKMCGHRQGWKTRERLLIQSWRSTGGLIEDRVVARAARALAEMSGCGHDVTRNSNLDMFPGKVPSCVSQDVCVLL